MYDYGDRATGLEDFIKNTRTVSVLNVAVKCIKLEYIL